MRRPLLSLAILGLFTVNADAQNLVVYDAAAGAFVEGVGISPLYPIAGVMLNAYPAVLPPPPAPGLGGVTIDATGGMTYHTDGVVVASVPHNAYAPMPPAPPLPPMPAPPLITPAGAPMGPLSGIAIDPLAGILWVTDGVFLAGLAPLPGLPPLVPPFALPFPALAPPITGLESDTATGTLWACDGAGFVYNFVPAPPGPMIAGPLPPAAPMPGPVTGVTIDKTGTGLVYIVGGGAIQEIATGVLFPSFGGMDVGLTFHPAPNPMPVAPCQCPNFAMGQALRGPMTTGNPNFGVDITGLPAGNPVIYAFDFFFNPAFPQLNASGCPLGLVIGSPTLISVFGLANPAGVAAFPLSLVGVPPGFPLYMQYGTVCPADPFGWVITPIYQVTVSAP